MGDAAVSALVKDVLGRLTSELIKEFGLLWGFKDDILTLKDDFDLIEAILQDAEHKHNKDTAVKLWLQRLRSASLKAENVLDEISTEAMIQRLCEERGLKDRVRAFFSSDHNQLMFRVRIAHKVKAIRKKLDDIASKRLKLSLIPSVGSHVDVDVAGEMPNRETSSLIYDPSSIFGRNEEMQMVTKKICNKDIGKHANGEIRVYGIWGMGGVGKTTLAQLVYNHERVNKYFELKCWVYVSEKFQVKEIIQKIIESIGKCERTLTQLDTLQNSLQNKLKEKKFLIVLDDVWIEEDEKAKWDELSKTLSCGIEGSIVVMTTRSNVTSRMMAKVPELQHKLGCISEEDSWSLFKKFAFAEGREGDAMSKLEPIGKEIVEKCKGLPLAVKTLCSLMWSKRSTRDWQHVRDNNIWELQENNVLPALKLSYDYLLPHLKRCFAYCCLFPKGYEIEKDVLIQLWVGNNFIPPIGGKDLYMLGEEILNCLAWRSFFQVVNANKCHRNNTYIYKMHDLMHDMALHVMGDGCLVIEHASKVKIPDEVFHLSSSRPEFLFSPFKLRNLTSLRSILMLGRINESRISQIFNQVNLRVLYLCNIRLTTLPGSICKLKHLRYLNLSKSGIEVLPDSIIYLHNLQLLLLYSCYILRKLPEGMRYMVNLQCLDIHSCYLLYHLPLGIKELTNLQILPKFPVGKKSGAKIGELGDLNLLEGELEIQRLENVGDLSEAKSANLKCKTNLSVLKLSWSYIETEPERFKYNEEVPEGLEPNHGLKELKIYYYMGKSLSPSWMINLKNLVKITFFRCDKCEQIPALGRLPNLRVINLRFMYRLKYFHEDDVNMSGDTTILFLSLQKLNIFCCSNLVSLPGNLPKVEVLKIKECGELVSLPGNLPNIRKLHLEACVGLLSLPDEIDRFKDLNQLKILDCKHLRKGCDKEMGEDWPKLSHTPNVIISQDFYSDLGKFLKRRA